MRQGFTIPGGLADVLADVRFRVKLTPVASCPPGRVRTPVPQENLLQHFSPATPLLLYYKFKLISFWRNLCNAMANNGIKRKSD